MNPTHIGLTLGPIYRTLKFARKTRELWVCSYVFSYLMEQVRLQLKDYASQILLPSESDAHILGAGLYPDRLIMAGDGAVNDALQAACKAAKQSLADAMVSFHYKQRRMRPTPAEAIAFVNGYFQMYTVHVVVAEQENAVLIVNGYLDTLDLMPQYQPNESEWNLLFDLLAENPATWSLAKAAYGDTDKKARLFPSLPEIASAGLEIVNAESYQDLISTWLRDEEAADNGSSSSSEDTLVQRLKQAFGDNFRTYHKYVALVHADGDKIRKTIEGLTSMADFQRFSKALLDFGKSAASLIDQYGGMPIYIGGDDLLFFAPVSMGGNENILQLIAKLDANFSSIMAENSLGEPTLSFGMVLSYHKFPMHEALEISRNMLFQKAKKFEGMGGCKHAVGLSLILHSGKKRDALLQLGSGTFREFETLLQMVLDGKLSTLQSVSKMLGNLEQLLATLGMIPDRSTRAHRIHSAFEGFLNEDVHDEALHKGYIYQVERLLVLALDDLKDRDAQTTLACIKEVAVLLDMVHFLQRKDNDDE